MRTTSSDCTADATEYRQLLDGNGFDVLDHVVEDPECGRHTVWIGRLRR